MADYFGENCAVCAQAFAPGDDIVVCPDCGTPYHRACWAKVGHCVHEGEHAAGFVWQPAARAGEAANICPNCGTRNAPGATKCSHCGVPLPAPEQGADPRPIYAREGDAYPNSAARAPGGPRGTDEPTMSAYAAGKDGGIYRRELGPDDTIDGIKAKDWSRYVGASSPFYLMQFFRMSLTKRRVGACFSAFFFGPLYFFYRKMWAEGIRFALLLLALEVPSVLALLAGAGVAPVAGWSMGWLPALTEVCYIASWVVRVLMGMFAVYWYKQSAARHIKAIYEQIPEGPDRTEALMFTGGTSLPAAVIYLLAYFALAGALAVAVGPYLQTVLSDMMI